MFMLASNDSNTSVDI